MRERRPPILVLGGLASALAAAMGASSLTTWWIGGWRMARLGPDGIPMGPITSLLFILLGLSATAIIFRPHSPAARRASLLVATLTLIASALAAVQWMSYFPLPWDSWLLGSERVVGAMPLGRMSPLTTIAFVLTSLGYSAAVAHELKGRPFRVPGLVATGLALLVGLEAVASFAAATPRYYGGRTTPMAVLTAAAFAALNFGLLALNANSGLVSEWLRPRSPAESPGFRRREIAAGIVVILLVAFGSLLYLRRGQHAARTAAHDQLDAIANLKTAQVSSWRNERLGEARFLLRTRAVAVDIEALAARPNDARARENVVNWLEPLRGGDRYESAHVYGVGGQLLLSSPPGATGAAISQDAFQTVFSSEDVVVADLKKGEDGRLHLDFLVPIRTESAGRRPTAGEALVPIAVVALRLNPRHELFPVVRSWPVPSTTAEALLVRREGNQIAFLSELRHFAGGPMTLRLSVDDPYLPAAARLRGQVDAREGLDYRGVAVLATSRPIPDSPWVLVAKIDQSEAYGPIRREAARSIAMVGLLLATLGLTGASLSRRRQASSLRRALHAEQERNLMAERLALVTRHANDIILLADRDGRVIEANDRALAAYGYSLDEIRALPPGALRPAETAGDLGPQLDILESQDGAVFETRQRRRDGSVFPVEVSARAVALGGRRAFLFITRDISQRKEHEAEIERLARLRDAHSQVNQAIVHAESREMLLQEVCRSLVESGPFQMAWLGFRDAATGRVAPVAEFGDRCALRVSANESPEGLGPTETAIREKRTVVCDELMRGAGERAGPRACVALPVRLGGEVWGALTVYAGEGGPFGTEEISLLEEAALDLSFGLESLDRESRRRQAEAAIRESEERLRLALMAGEQGLYDLDIRSGRAVVSDEYATMLGYDPAEFKETNEAWIQRVHPDDREQAGEAYRDYVEGRRPDYRIEFRQKTKSGSWKWILSTGRILERGPDGAPLRMLGTHTDITHRKLAEEALEASLREKQALLKEVHHRVKNNLQVITSLLRLEGRRSGDAATKGVLRDMQERIRSMALLHETLYRSGTFSRVDLADYLSQLATRLFRSQNLEPEAVLLNLDLDHGFVGIDQAIPCGLITNELLSNSLKHAFRHGQKGEVTVALKWDPAGPVRLSVSDSGAGLPGDFEARRGASLGLQLVSDLARQLGGTLGIGPGPGAAFSVAFAPNSGSAD